VKLTVGPAEGGKEPVAADAHRRHRGRRSSCGGGRGRRRQEENLVGMCRDSGATTPEEFGMSDLDVGNAGPNSFWPKYEMLCPGGKSPARQQFFFFFLGGSSEGRQRLVGGNTMGWVFF